MGKTDELVVVHRILSQTSDGYAHTVLVIYIQCHLRTIVVFQILDELLRSARKLCLLRKSLEVYELLYKLLFCNFFLKINENCCRMSVQDRNAHALACDLRQFCLHDLTVLYFTKDTERLLLALLFLTTDERDDISFHLRPVFTTSSFGPNSFHAARQGA